MVRVTFKLIPWSRLYNSLVQISEWNLVFQVLILKGGKVVECEGVLFQNHPQVL